MMQGSDFAVLPVCKQAGIAFELDHFAVVDVATFDHCFEWPHSVGAPCLKEYNSGFCLSMAGLHKLVCAKGRRKFSGPGTYEIVLCPGLAREAWMSLWARVGMRA